MSTRARPPGHEDWRGAIRLPDRTWVRGRGVRYPLPDGDRPEFGLYLGVDYEPSWEHVWLDWPNHFLPRDHVLAAGVIAEVSERVRDGQRVEVACKEGRMEQWGLGMPKRRTRADKGIGYCTNILRPRYFQERRDQELVTANCRQNEEACRAERETMST